MKLNRTVKLLMISDIFVISGFGLITPIMAVFINDKIIGGTIFTAGIASAVFMVTKGMIQLPFSSYVDSHNDKDGLKWLIVGTLLVACVPFLYIFSRTIFHIYVAEFIFGVGSGLAYPTWLGLWSRNLDGKKESFQWSLYSTFVAMGMAVSAALGAAIAEFVGFEFTFVFVGLMTMVGCFIIFHLRSTLEKKRKRRK